MTTDNMSRLKEALEQRRVERDKAKGIREGMGLSERDEYRRYLIDTRTKVHVYSSVAPMVYRLREIAESLLARLAAEHGIIDYPVDRDEIRIQEHIWRDIGVRKQRIAEKKAKLAELEKKVDEAGAVEEPDIAPQVQKRVKKVVEQDED